MLKFSRPVGEQSRSRDISGDDEEAGRRAVKVRGGETERRCRVQEEAPPAPLTPGGPDRRMCTNRVTRGNKSDKQPVWF